MCAEPVGGKGRKFLEEGRCQGGEAVPSEQSLLCRKPQLRENVRDLALPPLGPRTACASSFLQLGARDAL